MKIGNIVEPNSKGQIVIPKKVRDDLGITPNTPLNLVVRGGEICLYPVEGVIRGVITENIRSKIWQKTAGAWADQDWNEYDRKQKERKKIELEASKRRKKAW